MFIVHIFDNYFINKYGPILASASAGAWKRKFPPVLLRNYDTQDRPTPPSRFSAYIPDCTWSKGDPYEDGRDEAGRPVAGVEHLDQLRHEDPEGVGYPVSWNMSSMLYCLIFHAGIVTLLHVRFAQSLLVFVRVYYLSTYSVCAAVYFKFRIVVFV